MNGYVSVIERNSWPSTEEVANGRYEFKDFGFSPPIGNQALFHMFEHPEVHYSCSSFLRRFPKRVAVLSLGDTIGAQSGERLDGWGVEIEEGVVMWKLFLMLLVSVMFCVTSSYGWAMANNIGNAYSIGHPICAAMSLNVALARFAVNYLWEPQSNHLLSSPTLNPFFLAAATFGKGLLYLQSRLGILLVIIMQKLVGGALIGSWESVQILRGKSIASPTG